MLPPAIVLAVFVVGRAHMPGSRVWLCCGALGGFLAVALGAFGAHALRSVLSVSQMATFSTANDYLMSHSLVLLLVGVCLRHGASQFLVLAATLFLTGTTFFCGSLYILCLSSLRGVVWLTPLGGLLLLGGWATLAWGLFRQR